MASTASLAAGFTFLAFTGSGFAAQLLKLVRRHQQAKRQELAAEHVCDGMLPTREFAAYSAFLLFGLSGATRAYFDWMLVLTRFPVIVLSTMILWLLAHYRGRNAHRYFAAALVGDLLFVAIVSGGAIGLNYSKTLLPLLADQGLTAVSLFLFISKLSQARHMRATQRFAAVSLFREVGVMLKDCTGLWYTLGVGAELRWVAFTHIISIISSSLICIAKIAPTKTSGESATHP